MTGTTSTITTINFSISKPSLINKKSQRMLFILWDFFMPKRFGIFNLLHFRAISMSPNQKIKVGANAPIN
jgi:hypothetical protein